MVYFMLDTSIRSDQIVIPVSFDGIHVKFTFWMLSPHYSHASKVFFAFPCLGTAFIVPKTARDGPFKTRAAACCATRVLMNTSVHMSKMIEEGNLCKPAQRRQVPNVVGGALSSALADQINSTGRHDWWRGL